MAAIIDELSQLIFALNDNNIEYAVCGSLALTIHGFPHATFDIDILIRNESLEKAYEIAAQFGSIFADSIISFKERAVEIRRVSKIDEDSEVLPFDLLLVTEHVEDVWETKEKLIWQDREIWIVSREGLIRMKTLAGGAKDLIDIDRIENEEN